MAEQPDLFTQQFYQIWGNRFVLALKQKLAQTYSYAPGYGFDAYSNGRNAKYSGEAPKSIGGSALYDSITGNVTDSGDGFELFMNRYWEYVNYGRKKGSYVPITPLETWAQLKGFPNPRGAAFGISTNIYKFGIAPTFFYDEAINQLQIQFDRAVEDQFFKSIGDFFDNLFEENLE
jgi:hypothetical protein